MNNNKNPIIKNGVDECWVQLDYKKMPYFPVLNVAVISFPFVAFKCIVIAWH